MPPEVVTEALTTLRKTIGFVSGMNGMDVSGVCALSATAV